LDVGCRGHHVVLNWASSFPFLIRLRICCLSAAWIGARRARTGTNFLVDCILNHESTNCCCFYYCCWIGRRACFYWAWSWSRLFKVRKVFFYLSLLLINSLVVFYDLFLPLTCHSIFTHWIQIQRSRFACSCNTYTDRWDRLFPAPLCPCTPPTLLLLRCL
jgi:hypothetical protein